MQSLEQYRQTKAIGKSLDAKVTLSGRTDLLEKYRNSLPELFNVSQVELEFEARPHGHMKDTVAVADGRKCERCWRYVPDVGNEANYPTVCLRCAEALAAISYPPYSKEESAA